MILAPLNPTGQSVSHPPPEASRPAANHGEHHVLICNPTSPRWAESIAVPRDAESITLRLYDDALVMRCFFFLRRFSWLYRRDAVHLQVIAKY